jgi:hypothetical protein
MFGRPWLIIQNWSEVYWVYSLCSTFIYIFSKLLPYAPINIQQISPDVPAEEYVGRDVKCSLFSLDLNQNWHVCTDFFFNLHSGGWNQGPLDTAAINGLLCQPRVIMIMEKSVE